MKKIVLVLNLLLASLFVRAADQPLTTVPYVDVSKYLGTWYQIAKNPLFFEGDCYCAQQKLGLRSDGVVSVYNSCNEGSVSGRLREISGIAINDDTQTNARFTIDFNLPHKGQYWVIGLDSEYRYAVVSDPSRLSLYILSKTPQLAPELYQQALAQAAEQVDISKLQKAVQMGCTYP
jgi:apolipoprotein D and lipocalin family protein